MTATVLDLGQAISVELAPPCEAKYPPCRGRLPAEWVVWFACECVPRYVLACTRCDPIEDLRKAAWYIEREIARREATLGGGA